MRIEKLKEEIKNIREPRRTKYGNIRHKLEDIIIIGLCTVICGGEDYTDMEAFGVEREEFLRKFLELPNGIPDSDTFRRIFEKLKPNELSKFLINWIEVEREKRCVVAIEGKTEYTRYFITSLDNIEEFAYSVRKHWSIENQLHWSLDVTFLEDSSRTRKLILH